MPDPTRIQANVAALRAQGADDKDIEAYLAQQGVKPDAPKSANLPPHDAREPEDEPASYAQQALGGIAALGRHIAPELQTAARAVTRERALPEMVEAVRHAGPPSLGSLVGRAINPAGSTLSDLMGLLQQTPSYQRADADIRRAEDSNPVSDWNAGIGAGIGAAPMVEGGLGALKQAVLSPDGPLTKVRFAGKPIAAMKRGLASGYRSSLGVEGPMASASNIAPEPLALRPKGSTLAPWEEPPTPPSVLSELIAPPAESGPVVRNASPFKQRSAPKARFEHFADQFSQRQAAQQAGSTPVSDLSESDLLQMTLEHIRQGGTLKSAGDAIRMLITR